MNPILVERYKNRPAMYGLVPVVKAKVENSEKTLYQRQKAVLPPEF